MHIPKASGWIDSEKMLNIVQHIIGNEGLPTSFTGICSSIFS